MNTLCRVPAAAAGSVLGEERVDELVGVEVHQVVGRLAEADELDRDARASDWMASAMPPLAEPSSLVSTTPVRSTASVNCWACTRPFWPVVASRTSSTSVTLPGSRSATRRTLRSSSMRLTLVCSRPAVSASTRSAPCAAARCTASKMTELGSPPSAPRTRSAPARSAQVSSCSAAAARNVSPAAITTERPSSACRLPTLPIGGRLADAVHADEQPHVRRRPARSAACGRRWRGRP